MASKRAPEDSLEDSTTSKPKRICMERQQEDSSKDSTTSRPKHTCMQCEQEDEDEECPPRPYQQKIKYRQDDPEIGIKWDGWNRPTRWNWGKKPRYLVDGEPDTNTLPSFLKKLAPKIKSRYGSALKSLSTKSPSNMKELPSEIRELYEASKAAAFSKRLDPEIRDRYESNKSAPFFRLLPPEIRLSIYSFVFERKTMHVAVRECLYQEKGSWSSATWWRDHILGFRGALADSLKFTHSICFDEHDGEESPSGFSTGDRYWHRHKDCLLTIRNLQSTEDQDPKVPVWRWADRKPEIPWETDLTGEDYAKRLPFITRTHATSGLNLGLLRVCRQIHAEAALIPFQRTIFAFREQKVMDRFLYHCLLTPQRDAIQHIRFDAGGRMINSRIDASPFHVEGGIVGQYTLKGLRVMELEIDYSAEEIPTTSRYCVPEERDSGSDVLRNPVNVRVNVAVNPNTSHPRPVEVVRQFAQDIEETLQNGIRKRRPGNWK